MKNTSHGETKTQHYKLIWGILRKHVPKKINKKYSGISTNKLFNLVRRQNLKSKGVFYKRLKEMESEGLILCEPIKNRKYIRISDFLIRVKGQTLRGRAYYERFLIFYENAFKSAKSRKEKESLLQLGENMRGISIAQLGFIISNDWRMAKTENWRRNLVNVVIPKFSADLSYFLNRCSEIENKYVKSLIPSWQKKRGDMLEGELKKYQVGSKRILLSLRDKYPRKYAPTGI